MKETYLPHGDVPNWVRLSYAPRYLKKHKISRANLFRLLREEGALNNSNVPAQELIDDGLFDYKVVEGRGRYGRATYAVPYVSAKGLAVIEDILQNLTTTNNN